MHLKFQARMGGSARADIAAVVSSPPFSAQVTCHSAQCSFHRLIQLSKVSCFFFIFMVTVHRWFHKSNCHVKGTLKGFSICLIFNLHARYTQHKLVENLYHKYRSTWLSSERHSFLFVRQTYRLTVWKVASCSLGVWFQFRRAVFKCCSSINS